MNHIFKSSQKYIAVVLLLIVCAGCTFAGSGHSSLPDFLMGLWHGSIIITSSFCSIFSDHVGVAWYHPSVGYKLFYFFGLVFFSWNFGLLAGGVSFLFFLFS